MMEWMALTLVHCASTSKPPHIGVNGMKITVLSVLTHTFVGTKLFILHTTCHVC